jgi:hypothetical protein
VGAAAGIAFGMLARIRWPARPGAPVEAIHGD